MKVVVRATSPKEGTFSARSNLYAVRTAFITRRRQLPVWPNYASRDEELNCSLVTLLNLMQQTKDPELYTITVVRLLRSRFNRTV